MGNKFAALIPAAGYSSRMGLFKPLLPLDSALVIEKPILAFLDAGVRDISVIVGHKAHLLLPVIRRLGVKAIYNPNYDQGMYTSVQAGVKSLQDGLAAFFLLPADYALVKPETIRSLSRAFENINVSSNCEVIYPVFKRKKGHPPLISTQFKETIISEEPKGGLRELLQKKVCTHQEVLVEDNGILFDLDSESDYRQVLAQELADFPCRQECMRILQEQQTDQHLLDHVQEVSRVGGIIAEYLNSRGLRIHLGLVMAGGLLHDLAKGQKDHAQKGHDLLMRLGHPEVAEIIAEHMELRPQHTGMINETTIVYLADKLVKGSRVVSLEKRLREQTDRYKDDPVPLQSIRKRMGDALCIERKIEQILGLKVKDILAEQC